MKFLSEINTVPARLFNKFAGFQKGAVNRIRLTWPAVFGLPVETNLMQLYREDSEFSTWIDISNYASFFAAYDGVKVEFILTAYDREGEELGVAAVNLDAFQSLKTRLSSHVPGLDHYGIFTVNAKLWANDFSQIQFLLETSPQFMTCFIPRKADLSLQMIHSHKTLDSYLSIKKPNVRVSRVTENLSEMEELSIFFLNSSSHEVQSQLRVQSFAGGILFQSGFALPPKGVHHLTWRPTAAVREGNDLFCFYEFSYDRVINHRKPIVFRRFKDGSVSANHT